MTSGEPAFLADTRAAYDATANDYATTVPAQLDDMPVSRAIFAAFAELVRANGTGPVADVGCGPGHITELLHRHGLDIHGTDLSPAMIAAARRRYPHLRFETGSMLRIDRPDAALAGLVAHYSIIHIPWENRDALFAEFRRVLRPGGQLLLGFQIGAERRQRDESFGKPVRLVSFRQTPQQVTELLHRNGFTVHTTVGFEPDGAGPPGALIMAGAS